MGYNVDFMILNVLCNLSRCEIEARGARKRYSGKVCQTNETYPLSRPDLAHELTKRSSSASIESLMSALADAQVDLNPHQVEAALFAFRPLLEGRSSPMRSAWARP